MEPSSHTILQSASDHHHNLLHHQANNTLSLTGSDDELNRGMMLAASPVESIIIHRRPANCRSMSSISLSVSASVNDSDDEHELTVGAAHPSFSAHHVSGVRQRLSLLCVSVL